MASTLKDDLSLKVIRLSKPSFNITTPLVYENSDAAFQTINKEYVMKPFGISTMMSIPSTVGKTFLGETFSSYISINNGSTNNVTNVTIQVSLKTPRGSRQVLLDVSQGSIPVFSSGDSQDFVISQEIEEEGTFILICLVSYIRCDGEKKSFKKYFQFEVEQPLQMTSKTHLIGNDSFTEIQIKNSSVVPFCIDSIEFIPENSFTAKSLNENTFEGQHNDENIIIKPLSWLKPGQIHQHLYQIFEKDKSTKKQFKSPQQVIGHLEIEWKSNIGGGGKIVTPPIKRIVPRPKDFQLEIIDIPSIIELEVPFHATCVIKNCSTQKLTPKLCAAVEKQAGIMINGISGSILETIQPGDKIKAILSLFPLFPGLQSISGLRIVEQQFDKTFEFDHVVDVFVQSPCV